MCGGGGTRMESDIEKPLLKVAGVLMVERVVSALVESRRFDRIIAVVSRNTPKTKEFLQSRRVETIETAGDGFSQDLSFLAKLRPARVLVVPADIPLLDAEIASEIADIVQSAPAVSIVMEKEFVESIGVNPSVVFDRYCHSGITIFDTTQVGDAIVQEQYVVMNRKEIAVNVNTKVEWELAEKLLVQRVHDFAKDAGF